MSDQPEAESWIKRWYSRAYSYLLSHKDAAASLNAQIQIVVAIGGIFVAILAVGFCSRIENPLANAEAPPAEIANSKALTPTSSAPSAQGSGNETPKGMPELPPPRVEERGAAEWIAWRNANLGVRPDLPTQFDDDYPDCVENLRSLAIAEVGLGDSEACRLDLESHRTRYLVPLYARRESYGRAIRNERTRLYTRARSDDENVLLERIGAEDRDLNYPDGAAFRAFRRAEQKLAADIDLCIANNCHSRR